MRLEEFLSISFLFFHLSFNFIMSDVNRAIVFSFSNIIFSFSNIIFLYFSKHVCKCQYKLFFDENLA